MLMSRFQIAATALAGLALSSMGALAQESPYKGAQINFVVSADAGNSYDMFARMIGRYLPRHIPGQPLVIVQNMPGAGGLRAANWLYNVAPKDGLTIGMINNTLPFDPLYSNKQAQFDLKVKIIPGYKSQTEGFLGMERGENDGNASPFWSSLSSEFPQWIEEKKIRPLVYYGALRVPEIEAPHALDLLKDPEKRAIMEIAQAGLGMGRPMLAPPGVDPGKVSILRKAVAATFADENYKAECAKARLNCASPSTGDELAALVQQIYASPKSAVDKITEIYMQGQQK